MAGRSSRAAAKHAHRLFTPGPGSAGSVFAPAGSDEFDESDVVWGIPPAEPRKPAGSARTGRKKPSTAAATAAAAAAAAAVPVSIPDWSKILREEEEEQCGGKTRRWEVGEDDEDQWGEGAGSMIPPHELLDRNRAASFSVHEGVGRTLKGRDLSRVRNAIWEKTGFQD